MSLSTSTPTEGWRQGTDLWVFAYGSLMWNPGFTHAEVCTARLFGYHRALCILSLLWRGTPERPGLVLGLDRGGSCPGRAFRVEAALVPDTMERLYAREMPSGVYVPRFLPVRLEDGRRVTAWTFLARRDHPQYRRDDGSEAAAALIRQGTGKAGPCRDYLANTLEQLHRLGLRDRRLENLLRRADQPSPSS